MGRSYPYSPLMNRKPEDATWPSPYHPRDLDFTRLWSNEILREFTNSLKFARAVLDPKLIWEPTGENFEEPAAWAKLLGVTVYTGHSDKLAFFLHKPGCVTRTFYACRPTDLSHAIREYAKHAKAPQCDDE